VNILGISAFYHDSAAALVTDTTILAAAQEERFSRKKHDPGFPIGAIQYCLDHAGCTLSDLDAVVFYDKPFLKFERLLETYYAYSPKGWRSFLKSMPIWMGEKLFMKRLLYKELKSVGQFKKKDFQLLFPEHHLSHAASAFYPSPFKDAAILTVDGVGEWATASICKGQGKDISVLRELHFPHSLGLLYSAFTYYLGFRVNSGEYKLMGLAPYGNPHSERVRSFREKILSELVSLKDDGSIWLNPKYFRYATGFRMAVDPRWQQLFGFPRREAESDLEQIHCDLALAAQQVTEEAVLRLARTARELTGSKHLCLAGGVALNCVANGKLQQAGIFDQIWIQPAAGDAGGALGAALAARHIYYGEEREVASGRDGMQGAYLGPEFERLEVEKMVRRFGANGKPMERAALNQLVAQRLADGAAVGWMQGRMEFGPRALGNRSILGDPRNPEMQRKLNLKIKYRESFRPFAPAVLADRATKLFELEDDSPYMLLVQPVQAALRNALPEGYHDLPLREKLYFERSSFPAITHIDFSARIQTVHSDTNPHFHSLLTTFQDLTGSPALVNTSFNVRGEPIVCTPDDAYRCFMRTEMDVLVVNDWVFEKTDQPDWAEKDAWQEEFKLD